MRLATLGHDFVVKPVVHHTGLSVSTLYSHYIVSIFFPYVPKMYIKRSRMKPELIEREEKNKKIKIQLLGTNSTPLAPIVLPVSDAWALGKSARVNKGGARDGFNGARARLVGIPLDGIR